MKNQELIERFWKIPYDTLQLDVFRENGQVILQGFKLKAVKEWGWKVPIDQNAKGMLVNLRFDKAKTNNSDNFSRFLESDFYEKFTMEDPGEFNCPVETKEEAVEFILTLMNVVYGNIHFEMQLNLY